MIEALGARPVFVRTEEDFEDLAGIVLPGGESTVQLKLLERLGLDAPLRRLVQTGAPVLATCAGLILAATRVSAPEQRCLGFIDVHVARNAWGRQVDSFETKSDEGYPLVFIRAPRILHVGSSVDVLDRFCGEPILVQCRNITCATFHPELTDDARIHRRVFGALITTPFRPQGLSLAAGARLSALAMKVPAAR
jgi:5'-phosphate synthase pdxT subunit